MWVRAAVLAAVVTAAAVLLGCGASHRAAPGAVQTVPSPPARIGGAPAQPRIAVIVMENRAYGDVVGSARAPFINRLARTGALATQSYAITHPSLPNYLALIGGSTFGIDSDCTDCSAGAAPNLAVQLSAAGRTWRAYMEGMPAPCFRGDDAGDVARYAKKHDPFMYFTRIAGDPAMCRNVVPFERLARDEHARRMADFTWITPDLCHDMHDCSVAVGDRFLAFVVPPLLRALGGHGLLIVTFDEGTSDDTCCRLAAGGRIATILAGPTVRAGARLATPVDHYSVLQLAEDLMGVRRLRGAACACTPSLGPMLIAGGTSVTRSGR